MEIKDLHKLEKHLGFKIKNESLLIEAFVHRSFLNENKDVAESNERLEFLGDAVLELVVTEFLFNNYPNSEGELTNWRSALVRGDNLAIIGRKLNLGDFLFLSKGEERSGGRDKDYILANTVEALIGAIYLDQGYMKAHKFIDKYIMQFLEEILEKGLHEDGKSKFQEQAQEKANITPHYEVISAIGPDHDKTFEMGVYLADEMVATGTGSSKKAAEEDAARNGLKAKGWNK